MYLLGLVFGLGFHTNNRNLERAADQWASPDIPRMQRDPRRKALHV